MPAPYPEAPAALPDHPHPPLKLMAQALRFLAADAVERAGSGHPGMPMGMADVATVLAHGFLRFDPDAPSWFDRDRLVLSAGHGSLLLYALHYLLGTRGIALEDLQNFRRLNSRTAGHPEYGLCPGVEATTGPLGQGLAMAVGLALAERKLNAHFGDDIINHHTYALVGDGCLMEGISHEAIDLAGHLRLARLIVVFDDNGISIDGATALSTSCDQRARFAASGWSVTGIDGHDPEEIAQALQAAQADPRPSLISCRTTIGYGAPNKQGTASAHGNPLGAEETAAARRALGWDSPAFVVPKEILAAWRAIAARGQTAHRAWQRHLAATDRQGPEGQGHDGLPEEQGSESLQGHDGRPKGQGHDGHRAQLSLKRIAGEVNAQFLASGRALATRQASQLMLAAVGPHLPFMIGGSADLTPSNLTRTAQQQVITADNYAGTYVHYGVREHAMAAAMNGLALHGLMPYGGSFLCFSDYCRPAIRLSAMMRLRVIYVMTHDSIGLGEDGPTHQPIEHLASLRAMPGLRVFRPADALETSAAWLAALTSDAGPSVLCLSRQGLPLLARDGEDDAQAGVARGAYLLSTRDESAARQVTLLASGSEVALAAEAAKVLRRRGLRVALVSMPCWEVWSQQPEDYRRWILGQAPRIGIEAAARFGWEAWLDRQDVFLGLDGFGASAPIADLYAHFGLTVAAICENACRLVGQDS